MVPETAGEEGRPAARFHWVVGSVVHGRSTPAWPGTGPVPATADGPAAYPDGVWISWRLLGGNNRELGRAARPFPDTSAAMADLLRLRAAGTAAVATVGALVGTGLWTWRLELNGERVAVSGRGYQRQRECRYNLTQFRTALSEALAPEDLPSVAATAHGCLAPGRRGRSTLGTSAPRGLSLSGAGALR